MRRIAEKTEQVGLVKTDAPAAAKQYLHQARAEQAADGDEDQRVRELAMVLEVDQRVGVGADQKIQVRRHARQPAEQHGGRDGFSVADGRRYARTDDALGDGIHVKKFW